MQTPKEGVTEREHGANFLKFQSQGLCYYFYRAVVRVHICSLCMCANGVHVQTVLFVPFDLNDTLVGGTETGTEEVLACQQALHPVRFGNALASVGDKGERSVVDGDK